MKHTLTSNVDEPDAQAGSVSLYRGADLSEPSRRMLFEALYRARYLQAHARLPDALERDHNDDYVQSGPQIAWEIWQAAHARVLELAAQICERRQDAHTSQYDKAVCRLCARDIRALLRAMDRSSI
ncbi:hypothetical protein WJ542_24145 [Paraburkholderia sp. B3]|uniref:hypothetical protein n=1 Tax=Paraburkholderia sp. B3 TaxID=3134791 RepID=UPI003981EF49